MGGNAECPWAISPKEKVAECSKKKAEKLGWKG